MITLPAFTLSSHQAAKLRICNHALSTFSKLLYEYNVKSLYDSILLIIFLLTLIHNTFGDISIPKLRYVASLALPPNISTSSDIASMVINLFDPSVVTGRSYSGRTVKEYSNKLFPLGYPWISQHKHGLTDQVYKLQNKGFNKKRSDSVQCSKLNSCKFIVRIERSENILEILPIHKQFSRDDNHY